MDPQDRKPSHRVLEVWRGNQKRPLLLGCLVKAGCLICGGLMCSSSGLLSSAVSAAASAILCAPEGGSCLLADSSPEPPSKPSSPCKDMHPLTSQHSVILPCFVLSTPSQQHCPESHDFDRWGPREPCLYSASQGPLEIPLQFRR